MTHTRWRDGGELPYLGRRIVLGPGPDRRQAALSGDADATRDGDTLWLPLPAEADQARVRDATQAWLRQRASDRFGARLGALPADQRRLTIRRWRLSSAAPRAGARAPATAASCSTGA